MTRFETAASAILLFCASTVANASLVYLLPEVQTVAAGEQVDVELWWDFTDEPALGGGVDIFYDPDLLAFRSFEYNLADPLIDSALTYFDFVGGGGEIDGISTGNFDGIDGPVRVGTASFDTFGLGLAVLSVATSDNPIAGVLFSAETFEPYPDGAIDFLGATVQIGTISEPGTLVLLLIGGSVLLAGRGRRRG